MNIANKEVMITCRRCGNIEPNLRYFDLHVHVCISLLLFCSHTHCIYMYMQFSFNPLDIHQINQIMSCTTDWLFPHQFLAYSFSIISPLKPVFILKSGTMGLPYIPFSLSRYPLLLQVYAEKHCFKIIYIHTYIHTTGSYHGLTYIQCYYYKSNQSHTHTMSAHCNHD